VVSVLKLDDRAFPVAVWHQIGEERPGTVVALPPLSRIAEATQ
jgi:hypothetical protein